MFTACRFGKAMERKVYVRVIFPLLRWVKTFLLADGSTSRFHVMTLVWWSGLYESAKVNQLITAVLCLFVGLFQI